MTMLLLLALLAQDPSDGLDDLIRGLGDDLIEVRERAHARLLKLGAPGIPALEKALQSPDAEVRFRAGVVLEIVGRADREREHDADQRAALLLLNRTSADVEAERRPGSGATGAARFDVTATEFGGGWIIATQGKDYLARRVPEGPGHSLFHFDIKGMAGADGVERAVERCGRCSPGKIFVPGPKRPSKLRIVGGQTWFSPYHLEFKDPCLGQKKRVGGFTIEVVGLALRTTAESSWPADWCRSMNPFCEFELKPEVKVGPRLRSFA